MSEREKLIQEYAQKKTLHDQQEESLRKSSYPFIQKDFKSEIRERKLSKPIISSSHCNLSDKSLAKSSKKSPKKNVFPPLTQILSSLPVEPGMLSVSRSKSIEPSLLLEQELPLIRPPSPSWKSFPEKLIPWFST